MFIAVPVDGTMIGHNAKALYKEAGRKMNVANPPTLKPPVVRALTF